ncbi:MAG: hypothetical protein IID44_09035 [Planctomycetes bacterium]|nr:hypothetical protein [Planctomycetota bacterium]
MSSPVCADGKLYCADTSGQIVVLAASNTFKTSPTTPSSKAPAAPPPSPAASCTCARSAT